MHAGDAELQLVLAALGDLVAELGLGEELTAQRDEVALAGFDDGVDVIRVPQGAAGGHGDGDALFHDLGEGHLPALLLVAVGAHAGQAGDDAAAVDGYHGHAVLLEDDGRVAQPLHGGGALVEVAAVHLGDDLNAGAGGLDAVDDLDGEAHGVLDVLRAVLVGPVVEVGAEELLAEVVVRIVPLDGVHAAGGAAQAGSDILALDVQYLVLGELVDYGDVLSALNGVGVGVGRAAGHPGLEGDLRAGGVHRRDRLLKLGYVLVVSKAGLGGHRAGPAEVYRHDAHGDHGHAALGHCFIIADIVLGGKSIFTQVTRHCRYDNPVLQDHFANADGL